MATSNARIAFQNLLENGTIVASSENASYPVANIYDWLTCDFFRPAAGGTVNIDLTLSVAAAADYFAFYNQDLSTVSGELCWNLGDEADQAALCGFNSMTSIPSWNLAPAMSFGN